MHLSCLIFQWVCLKIPCCCFAFPSSARKLFVSLLKILLHLINLAFSLSWMWVVQGWVVLMHCWCLHHLFVPLCLLNHFHLCSYQRGCIAPVDGLMNGSQWRIFYILHLYRHGFISSFVFIQKFKIYQILISRSFDVSDHNFALYRMTLPQPFSFPLIYSEAFELWITFTHSCTLYTSCLNLHNDYCLGFDSGRKYYLRLSAGLTMKDMIIWGWGAWLYLRLKYWLDFEKQFYLRLRC